LREVVGKEKFRRPPLRSFLGGQGKIKSVEVLLHIERGARGHTHLFGEFGC